MRTHTDRDVRMLVARSSVGGYHAPVSLADANLQLANLPHIDLRGADLRVANLRGAMLWGALLDGACLDGADLTCANLSWSSLAGCSMNGTLLVEAELEEAVVGSGLSSAVTIGADLTTTTLSAEAMTQLALKWTDETGAPRKMTEEEVNREQAQRASEEVIWKAHVQSAPPALRARASHALELSRARVLSDGDIRELLSWSAATGKPLNLRGCNLVGGDFRNASLREACLGFTDVAEADSRGADLAGADLRDSHGWRRSRKP